MQYWSGDALRGPSAHEYKCIARGEDVDFNEIVRKEGKVPGPGLLDSREAREAGAQTIDEDVIGGAQADESVRIMCIDARDERSDWGLRRIGDRRFHDV